ADRQEGGAHALIFDGRLCRDLEPEPIAPEREPVVEPPDHHADVMHPREHRRRLPRRSRASHPRVVSQFERRPTSARIVGRDSRRRGDKPRAYFYVGYATLGGRAYDVLMVCKTCGPDHQTETREPKLVSKGLRETIMCHQLACGHAWHRTAVIGSAALGAACNCRSLTVDAD